MRPSKVWLRVARSALFCGTCGFFVLSCNARNSDFLSFEESELIGMPTVEDTSESHEQEKNQKD